MNADGNICKSGSGYKYKFIREEKKMVEIYVQELLGNHRARMVMEQSEIQIEKVLLGKDKCRVARRASNEWWCRRAMITIKKGDKGLSTLVNAR